MLSGEAGRRGAIRGGAEPSGSAGRRQDQWGGADPSRGGGDARVAGAVAGKPDARRSRAGCADERGS
jgi:hypothetical protein